ncbi:MAG: HAD-IIA family hydrolase [Syntrophobacterales bacterium]|nr:HAD-IIA family hydrolase [Syntrophobacterales bacterium]
MVKDCVILAAGIGSRLRPITFEKPKCLVKVQGIPIIIHQLRAYIDAGIKNINVAVGYKADLVQEEVRKYLIKSDFWDVNVNFVVNEDYDVTNNMFSLYLVMKQVGLYGKSFLLSNGDVVYEHSIIRDVSESKETDLIVADKNSYNIESMKVTVDGLGYVSGISKEISKDVAFGNSLDLYKFSEEASLRLYFLMKNIVEVEGRLKEWTEVAIDRLIKAGEWKSRPFDIAGRKWVEIDNYDDLAIADKVFSKVGKFSSKNLFFLDLDGTVYLGEELLPGSREFIASLLKKGYRFYFISNNSSRSKNDYAKKLSRLLGLEISSDHIVLSTDGVVDFLRNRKIRKVYLVGTESMRSELEKAGILISEEDPQLVVVGYDTELTYDKIKKACISINKGIDYIATHPDVVCPTEHGFIPDAGAIVEMVKVTTGKEPMKIFGKPNKEIIKYIVESGKAEGKNMVFIGDRIYTDMVLARNVGGIFVLTLTGETTRDMVEHLVDWPELIVKDLSQLVEFL